MDNIKTCDSNCLDCKRYYACEIEEKLDEATRDFWLNEREQNE